jgi:hypothetical protein
MQIMPPEEASTFMLDVEFILIISALIITAIFVIDRVKKKWADR